MPHLRTMSQQHLATQEVLVAKPEGNRPFRKFQYDNMYLTVKWYEDVDWTNLAQDMVQCRAVVNTVMDVLDP